MGWGGLNMGLVDARVGVLVLAFAAAAALTLEHALAPLHAGLLEEPRNPLLTFASGVAAAFVWLRLIPLVAEGELGVEQLLAGTPLGVVKRPAFTVSVLSLLLFYVLFRLMQRGKRKNQEKQQDQRGGASEWEDQSRQKDGSSRSGKGLFWLHAPIYALLNVVIGMLVMQQAEDGWRAVVLFLVAKGSALFVLDHAFFDQHGGLYDRFGRWLTTLGIPIGVALRLWVLPLSDPAVTLLLAVLGGAILFNAIAEETPPKRQSPMWAFILGGLSYTVLLSAL